MDASQNYSVAQLVVNGTLNATGATFTQTGGWTTNLIVNSGGNLVSTNSTFGYSGVTLNTGANVVFDANASGKTFNFGAGGSSQSLTNFTSITAENGATIVVPESLNVNGSAIVTVSPNSALNVAGNLLGNTQNTAAFNPRGTVTLNGSGTSSAPELLEAMSADLGTAPTSFVNNFAFGSLILGSNTYVKLVNQVQNSAGSNPEAVYTNSLIVPTGSTLNLNGLHLYVRNAQIAGTITGGTITQIADSGALIVGNPTPGSISIAGELDNWTFFERAGTVMTIAVDPGSGALGGPINPSLQWVQVQLLDPTGKTVLATTSNTVAGAIATLTGVTLPVDGTYTIAINAPATHTSSTGNYVVTAYDVTPVIDSLTVNQVVTGTLSQPYSTHQWTFAATANTQVQFNLIAESASGLNFSLSGPNGYSGFSNLPGSSPLLTLPTSGIYTLTAQGTGGATGSYAFEVAQTGQIPLVLGVPKLGALVASGQAQLYTVTLASPGTLNVTLTDTNAQDQNEIYVSYGTAPTRYSYDYRFSGVPGPNQQVLLPAQAGTYYILTYANLVQSPGNYTIEAQSQSFILSGVKPGNIGTISDTTLQFAGLFPVSYGQGTNTGGAGSTATGAYLSTQPYVQFISAGGTTYPASKIYLSPASSGITSSAGGTTGTTVASAVLPAGTLPAGTYSVRVTDGSGFSQTLSNAVTVVQGGVGILKTNVIVPNPLGFHALATIQVQYTNVGNGPLAAPLLVLTATQNGKAGALLTLDKSKVVSGFWTSATPDGYGQSVQFLASGAVPGVLQPGESVTVPVYYAGWLSGQWDLSRPPINVSLGVLDTTNTQTVNWSSLQSSLKPASMSTSAWNAMFPIITSQLGSTWGNYVQALDQSAQYLASIGENVTDIGQLFSFIVQQANGYSPLSSLASATDASVAAPGLSLSLSRNFAPGIIARNSSSIFGWGWSTSWTTSLTVDSDGSVNVLGANGSLRRFQPDSRGGYFDQTGDHATLAKVSGGGFTLTEINGQVTAFNSNGTLNYIQDTNGNRITATYTNGLLTKLTHSSGQFLTLAYNATGLVSTITDSAGRVTTYQYDTTNKYLTSVVDFNGQTISYAYDTGTNATTANALLSVTHSDGSHDIYSYDAQGRLADAHRDGGVDDTAFAYNQGQVRVTNGLGNTTVYSFENRGLLLQVQNPLGNTVHYTYDGNLNLIKTTDAVGQTYTNNYDNYGNVISSTDALGNTVVYTYLCANDRLASVTDAKGNMTLYGYNGTGDLTSTTYADGTVASVAYDPIGNVVKSVDQMGQATQYTRDVAGNVLTEKFADGTQTTFTYDSHENLTSATDASGTTTLVYDVNDRLTKITYPSGRYLQYSYDTAGRRTQMVDQTGFTVNYSYDVLGNLATLTDGTGSMIVHYTYDTVGRLSREDHGNGTYVAYTYDAAGELLHLVNYVPNGSVNSRFDYTYDSLGRRVTESTVDGAWAYSYDAIGELTHAAFKSTNSNITNQDLAYSYDAAGNRTQTVINGVTTVYTTNNMNEYTQVGNTQYTYNADGDQISATNPSETTNYTFNVQNQLVGITNPSGSWTYQYDAFGDRMGTTQNGMTTQYLIDPMGLGNVVAALDVATGAITHFEYGLGLVAQINSTPSALYYDFDGLGSAIGISTSNGVYVNTYGYLPYGQMLIATGMIPNAFTFAGSWGLQTDDSGLTFMRARYYDASHGDFISDDPLGNQGISSGRYTYGDNDPLGNVDPTGLAPLQITIHPLPWYEQLLNAGINKIVDKGLNKFAEKAEDALGTTVAVPAAEYVTGVWVDSPVFLSLLADPATAPLAVLSIPLVYYATLYDVNTLFKYDFDQAINFIEPLIKQLVYSLIQSVNSTDPNSLTGPMGFGTQAFVNPSSPLPYKINFENAPTATAPAQRVVITNQLDPNLNWNTFQWSSFAFGNNVIYIPPNTQNYQTTVPMTYNNVTFRVVINLSLNPATGVITATFQSLNAANLMSGNALCPGTLSLGPADPFADLPPNVLIGFLPPEDGTGRGIGSVSYTVQPKAGLATGTQIRDVALITFDQNNSIATNQKDETDPTKGTDSTKEALVTIDAVAPTSSVSTLPSQSKDGFTLTWTGQDDTGGSGVASYDIYVSDNGGAYVRYLQGTTLTSTTFSGINGHQYSFYSVAIDNVGNTEAAPATPDATTIDIVPNHAPVGTATTITMSQNTSYAFTAGDFGFIDTNDTPPNKLQTVIITALPVAGSLTDKGIVVGLGGSVPVGDINAGKLLFTPATNAWGTAYASFLFAVQDDGGVLFGGIDTDPNPKKMTINVATVPTVTSPIFTNLTDTTVKLGGNVTLDGGTSVTARGVLYAPTSVNSNPQVGGTGVINVPAGGTTGVFTVNVSNLTQGTGYSFVAYAINGAGTTYTTPASTFTTLASPIVINPTSTSVTDTTATLGGNVSSDDGSPITSRGVVYALTSINGHPQIGGTGATNVTTSGTTGIFTVPATGLTPGVGYSFVAYATNAIGTTYTTPVSSFTTLIAPTVTTPTSSNVSNGTATLGGTVASDGGSPIIERGVIYSLLSANPNPQIGGAGVTKAPTSGTTGVFTVNVSNLNPNSVYCFVAYATNSIGTTYTTPAKTFATGPVTVASVYQGTGPTLIHTGDTLTSSVSAVSVHFSDNLNSVAGGANSVTNPSNWLLFRYGEDVSYEISGITFTANPNTLQYVATASFSVPLFQGGYRLIVRQGIQDGIGRPLDGDGNGIPGGDFGINFYVAQTVNGVSDVAPWLYQMEPIPLNAVGPLSTPVTSTLLAFDADSNNWTGATIQIAINYLSDQDVLGFVNTPSITGTWNASTGTLTLSGTDTVSNYRAALRNVTYHNTSATPNTSVTRTIDFQSTDGLLPSNVITRDVTVMASSIPAVISNVTGTGTFYEGDPAFAVAAGLTISDPNNVNLSSATLSFTNWQGEDRLEFNNIFALQHTFTQDLVAHTATFTITGLDTVDHYQTLLRSVLYWDVSANPVTATRVANFTVTDGLSTSNLATRNIVDVAVNQVPALNGIETSPLAYKANDPAFPALPISSTLLVGDPDSNNLSKATVQITSGYENDANGNDILSFTNQLGITGSFNATTGTLTLSGTSSVSNYRTALRSVTFSSSGPAVSSANRTLTIIATDDYSPTLANSLATTRTVTVLTTNSPPGVTGIPSTAVSYIRGAAAVAVVPSLLILDPDSINMAGATVQISGNYQNGQDVLAATTGLGITGSFDVPSGTLTLSGISSIANYQTVLHSLTYKTNTTGASTATRAISFTVNDGLANSSTVIRNVTLS